MKTKLLTLSAIAALFLANQASAAPIFQYSNYRDVDYVGALLSNVPGQNQEDRSFATGVFDIKDDDGDVYTWDKAGFDPNSQVITGAEVGFGFYDLSGATPSYLGDFRYLLGESLTPIGGTVGVDPVSTEFEFTLVTPVFGKITGDLLLDLETDGRLAWRVELDDDFGGNVTLFWAALAADAEQVPDSGNTAALLGLSLFAGVLIRRRIRVLV